PSSAIPTAIRYNSSDIEGRKKTAGEAPDDSQSRPRNWPGHSADNRQDIDAVFATHLTAEDRILKLGRELRRRANAANGAERSAENDRARHKFCSGARHQVGGIAHRRQQALLVFQALAVDGDVGAQIQLVPMAGNIFETPQGFAD